MRIYAAMRRLKPDFFIHSGDTIYADAPIQSEVKLADGKIGRNLVTSEKSKVAETFKEFSGNYLNNLMDENIRRFNAEVPQVKFSSVPPGCPQNIPPTAGLQFFGQVKINGESQVMTVAHYNLDDKKVYSIDLSPEKQ